MKKKINLSDIKMLVADVDGVLTDGGLIINGDGSEAKVFNVRDGHGIKLWQRAGLKLAFLSGRNSEPTKRRAEQLNVDYCLMGCLEKLPRFKELLKNAGLSAKNVAYVGDDLTDLPVIRYSGLGVAVANSVEEVRQNADFVTTCFGGNGAVREVIEYILKNSNRWDKLMERYKG